MWLLVALLLTIASCGHGQSYTPHQHGKQQISSSNAERNDTPKFHRMEREERMSEVTPKDYHQGNAEDRNDILILDSSSLPRSPRQLESLLSSHEQGQDQSQPPPSSRALRGRQVQEVTTYPPRKQSDGIKKIVQCKGGVAEDICKQELVDNGVTIVNDMKDTVFFAVCVHTQEEIDLVGQLTRIESIEDDPPRTLAHIPGSRRIRNLQADEQIIPYGVDLVKAPEFWDHYGSKGAGVTVCVIDSGLRTSHEDFEGADLSGSNDLEHFLPWDEAGLSHGTHVTGIIAARDNNVGVVGVAPEVSIYMVRLVNDSGNFTASDLIVAMGACGKAGVDIISMSLGGSDATNAEQNYIRQLRKSGVLPVASSGNQADLGYLFLYPAAYEGVVSVAAVDEKQHIATFSTYNLFVDLAAPGVEVISMGIKSDHSYVVEDGTSMAAPHVSGVAALLWSRFPNATVDDIVTALTESARDLGACGRDRHFGFGLVDAMAAAAYLENATVLPSDIENCVEVQINVTTDLWGDETLYIVTPNGRNDDILYREGPYFSQLIATYTSTFLLPSGCYDFIVFDTQGDGNNCLSNGGFTVAYDGVEEIDFDDFTGSQALLTFGDCN